MSAGPFNDVPRFAEYPRFRLRTLFFVVTLCGVLFGVMHALGPMASIGVAMVLATIGLHVAGNALGTMRRDATTQQVGERGHDPVDTSLVIEQCLQAKATHRLRESAPLGWTIRITTLLGATVGLVLGIVVLEQLTHAALPGLIFGAMSAAVLGGFFGFLSGSFLEVARRAWWQAMCESRRDQMRPHDG